MKLAHPFYRLPIRVDAERLRAEIAQFAESEWQRHPTGYAGNAAVRLITADGGENDAMVGAMASTAQLQRCPYIRQVLGFFGVVWSCSRLMRLAPGATVPKHADMNYHWFTRVRIHIPIVTAPGVRFSCGDQNVHMAAGEIWVFDNWRQHSVENASDLHRVHLVADTAGSASFWEGVLGSQSANFIERSGPEPIVLPFQPGKESKLLFERHNLATVLPPSEIEQLVHDLRDDLAAVGDDAQSRRALADFRSLLSGFCREWRLIWSLEADGPNGWPHYLQLRDYLKAEVEKLPIMVMCASNRLPAAAVLQSRVLAYAVTPNDDPASAPGIADFDRTLSPAPSTVAVSGAAAPVVKISAPTIRRPVQPLKQPLFIVAAPRSGSTLLFETLAQARDLVTVGGEAHWLVEGLPQLRPGASGVESNRLTAAHYAPAIGDQIKAALCEQLRDRDGQAVSADTTHLLEKTPKNALRIPFFDRIFPDARYIFLWREPQENLSSIIEAWRAGDWVTYRDLPGRKAPWSLLLPPGWQALHDAPLEDIAAFQWIETNRTVLDDLAQLPPECWTSLSYAAFLADPAGQTRRLCDFAGIEFDARLAARCSGALPLSVHTHTPPASGKWKRNEALIARMLPRTDAVHARLRTLGR